VFTILGIYWVVYMAKLLTPRTYIITERKLVKLAQELSRSPFQQTKVFESVMEHLNLSLIEIQKDLDHFLNNRG
jgi:hypothetical protein